MKNLIGKTFNGVTYIDMAIEKELGVEVVGFTESKHLDEVTYVFSTDDNRKIEVIVNESPYGVFVKTALFLA